MSAKSKGRAQSQERRDPGRAGPRSPRGRRGTTGARKRGQSVSVVEQPDVGAPGPSSSDMLRPAEASRPTHSQHLPSMQLCSSFPGVGGAEGRGGGCRVTRWYTSEPSLIPQSTCSERRVPQILLSCKNTTGKQ
ncbi:uncharacterized protein LOC127750474 [Frankliniella occidentalis]|uniref:Uncharacterized protein LOC127750474 n=1 Tax=Frankliniella occidentalis TaxID=133901 RepID=A0A9C6XR99_FRAOC|nr:uncharacterized protein LOC127750474 [Frankliniella occidentalis]